MPLRSLSLLDRAGDGNNAFDRLGGGGTDPLRRSLAGAPGPDAGQLRALAARTPDLSMRSTGVGAADLGMRQLGTPQRLAGLQPRMLGAGGAPGPAAATFAGGGGGMRQLSGGLTPLGMLESAGGMKPFGRQVTDPFAFAQKPTNPSGLAPGPPASNAGGKYAAVDAHNREVSAAAGKYGVPANLLKAMLIRESSGNWEANNRTHYARNSYMYPFVGVFAEAARSVGIDPAAMAGNKQLQLDAMAAILARDYGNFGSWEAAMSNYFTGNPNAYKTGQGDPEGTLAAYGGATYYVNQALSDWRAMDAAAGGYGASEGRRGYEGSGIQQAAVGNAFLQEAQKYVGVKYKWGGIPGINENPWVTGWDCSGFTYYLDQRYDTGRLPQGSHYQYEYAKSTGQLNGDPARMQAGDLVFLDTGWQGGAGAALNPAGHVGVYLGNGQMLHAANESLGTIVSPIGPYMDGFLGSMRMSWSGGGSGYNAPYGGSGYNAPQQGVPYGSTGSPGNYPTMGLSPYGGGPGSIFDQMRRNAGR